MELHTQSDEREIVDWYQPRSDNGNSETTKE